VTRSLLFKPLSLLAGVIGSLLASAVFGKVWQRISGEPTAPAPDSTEHPTSEVILAAVFQGALAGGIRAAVNRAGAKGIRSLARSGRDDTGGHDSPAYG
jgi:hypothetical protein